MSVAAILAVIGAAVGAATGLRALFPTLTAEERAQREAHAAELRGLRAKQKHERALAKIEAKAKKG